MSQHAGGPGELSASSGQEVWGGRGGWGEGLVSEQKGLGGHVHRRGVAIEQATNQISKQRSQSEQANLGRQNS